MNLWQGRFSKPLDQMADEFNASLPFDKALFRADIEASKAHAAMLGKTGILSAEDAAAIASGLDGILRDILAGDLAIEKAEDIHSFVENELTARIGDAGKRLHTARSRNDQVATDLRIDLRGKTDLLTEKLKLLVGAILDKAHGSLRYIMPGFTHLRKAQPVNAGMYFCAYAEMFLRDLSRIHAARKRMNVLPLGSAALAGTSYPVDREMTRELLGFGSVSQNAMDAVSDRDFVADFIYNCALVMAHLSRLAEDTILYSSDEFGYFEIPDELSTGSSIMPQKKNPDLPELVRGKTGRVYGDLMAILTVIKGIPMAYNKDLQEDKEPYFDAAKTAIDCVEIYTELLTRIKLNVNRMYDAAGAGYSTATDIADYLARHGVPFRDAHAVTGKLVQSCIARGKALTDLTAEEFKAFSPVFGEDITEAVKPRNSAEARNSVGGSSKEAVLSNIRSARRRLAKY